MKLSSITGVVLAGGQSRRMGKDKRFLEWNGQTFLDRVCGILKDIFEEVIVVGALQDYDCSHLSVRYVTDSIPGKGSMGGLYTGLMESTELFSFVVACDMPFLNKDVIRRLCSQPESDVAIVKLPTGVQPLHARYSKKCGVIVHEMITAGDLRIQGLAQDSRLTVRLIQDSVFDDVDPQRHSFLNMNTPADLEFVRKIGLGVS